MQTDEHNERIDAWNNLATIIKFLLLEKYIQRETANDITISLNKLAPLNEKTDELEEQIMDNQYKSKPGFIDEKEETLKIVSTKLVEITKKIVKINDEESRKLKKEFSELLNKTIDMR